MLVSTNALTKEGAPGS